MIIFGIFLYTLVFVFIILLFYLFWKYLKVEINLMLKEALILKAIIGLLFSVKKLFTKKDRVDVVNLLSKMKKEKLNGGNN